MIVDQLERAGQYSEDGSALRRALEYLERENLLAMEPGRIEIEGDEIYLMRQRYSTRAVDGALYEAHRRYLDVHLVLAGRETMYWAPTASLQVAETYVEDSDAQMLRDAVSTSPRAAVHLTTGTFAVVYPDDAHIPCCDWNATAEVEKAVVKVRLP